MPILERELGEMIVQLRQMYHRRDERYPEALVIAYLKVKIEGFGTKSEQKALEDMLTAEMKNSPVKLPLYLQSFLVGREDSDLLSDVDRFKLMVLKYVNCEVRGFVDSMKRRWLRLEIERLKKKVVLDEDWKWLVERLK
jgi:hypothetical protein